MSDIVLRQIRDELKGSSGSPAANVNIRDTNGTGISSTDNGGKQSLDVNVTSTISTTVGGIGATGDTAAPADGGNGELIPQAKRTNIELGELNTEILDQGTTLDDILTQVNGTKPVSLASVPLATDAATATLQSALNDLIGAENEAPADSTDGTHSLNALQKRELTRRYADRTSVSGVVATSGDNAATIAAPAAGNRIVITDLRVQNTTADETTVLFKSGTTTISHLITNAVGSGIDKDYDYGNELRLGTAEAFIINLSGATSHRVSVRYYVENATTGLPVSI